MAKISKQRSFASFGIFHTSNLKGKLLVFIIGLFILAISAAISGILGGINFNIKDLISLNLSETENSILFSIRIPRIIVAIIVGSALAVSGAALQALFRNPLADPSIIGVSAGSAFAVAIVIVLMEDLGGVWEIYGLSIAAFIGAVITSFLVFKLSNINNRESVAYMLLAGIAINAIAAAGTGFLAFISNDQQLRTLTFWTMGSFSGAIWISTLVASTVILPAIFILYKYSKQLNLLALGEDEARYLGINIKNLKSKIIVLVSLIVGASVAVSGIIGFVGLIIPHLLRIIYGSDNKFIIPASALFGAILVLISDTISRTVILPTEIPVGIITSLIGGPYFLYLLIRQINKN